MKRVAWCAVLAAAIAASGCSKKENASGERAATGAGDAMAAVDAAAPEDAATAAAATKAATLAGKYSLSPGTMYIPETKDWSRVKQATDEPSKLVGEGTLTLTIDAEGRVSGTIDSGPAAPAVLDGSLVGDEVRANVRRQTPSDQGLTGTLEGSRSGTRAKGTLSLAESNAAIVRHGTFEVEKK